MNTRELILTASRLRERDLQMLDSLFQHRFLTRQQLQSFHFADPGSPRPAQRRLHRLRLDGLILRRRLVRADGSREPEPYYCLTPDGAQVVAHRNQLPPGETRKSAADALAHPFYVRHALAVAELHRTLVQAAHTQPSHRCLPEWWRGEAETKAQFRERSGVVILRPDGYVRYQDGDDIHHLLVEVDQATMRLPRLVDKLVRYRGYQHSGSWQERYPVFPKLLLLTTTRQRITDLFQQLEPLPELVLLASTHHQLEQHGPLDAIWQQPGQPALRPLLNPTQ